MIFAPTGLTATFFVPAPSSPSQYADNAPRRPRMGVTPVTRRERTWCRVDGVSLAEAARGARPRPCRSSVPLLEPMI
jgi:hypothetical protein